MWGEKEPSASDGCSFMLLEQTLKIQQRYRCRVRVCGVMLLRAHDGVRDSRFDHE